MSQLLLFALGPVQDFIATARRCQDLWFGSWLLSDLSAAAARSMRDVVGTEALIVPGALTDGAAVANEVYLLAPDAPAADRAARAGERAVRDRLREHGDRFFADLPEGFHRAVAEAQVADLIETSWVAVPVVDYAQARRRAKALLAARKATRAWEQPPWSPLLERGVPKSSLDGTRECVIDERIYDDVREGRKSAEWLRKTFRARPAERLSGVDLLKRIGEELTDDGHSDGRPIFHSTSHIAAGPMRTRLARLGHGPFASWLGHLDSLFVDTDRFRIGAGGLTKTDLATPAPHTPIVTVPRALTRTGVPARSGFDGYILYEDRLPELLTEYRQAPADETAVNAARLALQNALKQLGWSRPVMPYYVLLLADGDRMGKVIDVVTTPAEHRAISTALDAWAQTCREQIELQLGTCIYAGGDDVLALLPLHTALHAARELAESFATAMVDAFKSVSPASRPAELPTLSVGLAVVHHLRPMRDALDTARRAEKTAKSLRNALAIHVDKRSGGELVVKGQWTEKRRDPETREWVDVTPLDRRIPDWTRLFHGEQLPDKVAFALEEAVSLWVDAPDSATARPSPDTGAAVVRALARRALGRRRGERGAEHIDAKLHRRLEGRIGTTDPAGDVRALSAELQIARLFLDAYEEAWGEEAFAAAPEED